VFLRLAKETTSADFVMVGGEDEESPELYDRVQREAAKIKNLRFEGYVPYEEVDGYFAVTDLFINTSTDEGFPNTFLQSLACGTPVLSLKVNPDGLLSKHDIGFHAEGDEAALQERLQELVSNPGQRANLAVQANEVFLDKYNIESIVDRYEAVFTGQ
jgi:glycosyltransferase involved in cell wall biosynthesis